MAAAFAAVIAALVVAVTLGSLAIARSGSTKPAHRSKPTVLTTIPPKPHTSTTIQRTTSTTLTRKPTVSPATSNFCGSQAQMQFVNTDDGWLSMGDGTILATVDQGRHWSTSYKGPDCVTSFDFVNAFDGWASLRWTRTSHCYLRPPFFIQKTVALRGLVTTAPGWVSLPSIWSLLRLAGPFPPQDKSFIPSMPGTPGKSSPRLEQSRTRGSP